MMGGNCVFDDTSNEKTNRDFFVHLKHMQWKLTGIVFGPLPKRRVPLKMQWFQWKIEQSERNRCQEAHKLHGFTLFLMFLNEK